MFRLTLASVPYARARILRREDHSRAAAFATGGGPAEGQHNGKLRSGAAGGQGDRRNGTPVDAGSSGQRPHTTRRSQVGVARGGAARRHPSKGRAGRRHAQRDQGVRRWSEYVLVSAYLSQGSRSPRSQAVRALRVRRASCGAAARRSTQVVRRQGRAQPRAGSAVSQEGSAHGPINASELCVLSVRRATGARRRCRVGRRASSGGAQRRRMECAGGEATGQTEDRCAVRVQNSSWIRPASTSQRVAQLPYLRSR
jgi:hypothetical protein